MADGERITFRCLQLRQPIGTFYTGAIDSVDLCAISYADIRRLEERDIEQYLGIQRTLNDARVKEISEYARTVDATFPTSVILAVKASDVEFDERLGVMSLPRHEGVAKIIDGQHRIAGLKSYRGPVFEVNCTIFLDMDVEDQANVFATINITQTKVSKSLVYDLYEYAKSRSPQKTSHNIARLLNRESSSPFAGRIKALGVATKGVKDQTLTQAAFVERLLPLISREPMKDRDDLKRGKAIAQAPENLRSALIFREMFIRERDSDIARVLWNYFGAAQRRWSDAWNTVERGNILNRTTGFAALMRFLPIVYRNSNAPDGVPPLGYFEGVFNAIGIGDSEFTPDNYKPGSSGEAALARQFMELSGLR